MGNPVQSGPVRKGSPTGSSGKTAREDRKRGERRKNENSLGTAALTDGYFIRVRINLTDNWDASGSAVGSDGRQWTQATYDSWP